uniref:Transmembrane protein n=1 Tax=Cucumis melo TaxID=3656 RepID=A0A9I9E657_CUCME
MYCLNFGQTTNQIVRILLLASAFSSMFYYLLLFVPKLCIFWENRCQITRMNLGHLEVLIMAKRDGRIVENLFSQR